VLVLLVAVLAGALVAPTPPDRHQVVLRVTAEDGAATTWPVVDDLHDGDVLRVRMTGADGRAAGTVMQCTPSSCWNRFPVSFDDDGAAHFQYQVEQRDCAPATSCSVRVEVGDASAVALTVFGGPAPPAPDVALTPRRQVEPGAEITVDVEGLAPGAPAQASFCAETCGPRVTRSADDAGRVTLEVVAGPRCSGCGVAVVAGSSRALHTVTFAPAPAPRYDPGRLLAGLGAALVLLVAAWRLVVVTDWRPPSEAFVDDPPEPVRAIGPDAGGSP
jgi:hypothetical protein